MTGNIGIFQELVQGGPNGSIDADLLKKSQTYFTVNANNELEFVKGSVVSNDELATATGTDVAPSQNAVRTLLSTMDNDGRFLPADGTDGQVLIHDGTYGAVPRSAPQFTDLYHENFDFNCTHTTNSSPNHQTRTIGSGYNVNDYDLVRVYIGDASNISNVVPSQVRQFSNNIWRPTDIPASQVIPSNSNFERGRNRYMTGLMVDTWTFFELGNREDEPIHRLWSVSKDSNGRIRVNFLRQSRAGFEQDWFGFSGGIEMRVGVVGIRF